MRQVLAINVPRQSSSVAPERDLGVLPAKRSRRIGELPGVERVAVGTHRAVARCRQLRHRAPVHGRGLRQGRRRRGSARAASARSRRDSSPRSACRSSPAATSTTPTARDSEPVVIVSQSLARRMFPNGTRVNRQLMWTDPVMKFIGIEPGPRRIVGVAADVDDENVVPGPALTVYHPLRAGVRRRPAVRARAGRSLRARPADHARSSARSRPTSRSSGRPRSRTFAPKCWRRIG